MNNEKKRVLIFLEIKKREKEIRRFRIRNNQEMNEKDQTRPKIKERKKKKN